MNAVNLLLAGVLLVAAMVSAIYALYEGRLAFLLLSGAAILGLIFVYRADAKRESNEASEKARAEEARVQELMRASEQRGFKLAVRGSRLMVHGTLALMLGAFPLVGLALVSGPWRLADLGYGAVALLFIAMGAFPIAAGLRWLGKPVIELTAGGLSTPWSGLVRWEDIHGIHMSKATARSDRMYHLELLVPDVRRLSARFAWPVRWLYAMRPKSRTTIVVLLMRTSEPPEVIYRVARSLWVRRTGRDYSWNPQWSKELNAAQVQFKHATDVISRNPLDARDPIAFARELDEAVESAQRSSDVIVAEMRKDARKMRRLLWGFIVFLLLYVIGKLWRNLG